VSGDLIRGEFAIKTGVAYRNLVTDSVQMPMSESIDRKGARVCPLLQNYLPLPGTFDECAAGNGELRKPFTRFSEALPDLTATELKRRGEIARRIIHEQGITYNVHGDGLGRERPWQLDPLPLVIAEAEWRPLETALIQRATLINRVLADCYGPQDLIRSGWLPPALVFGQPDFLRPCHGLQPPGDVFLHLYAADLGLIYMGPRKRPVAVELPASALVPWADADGGQGQERG